MITAQVVDTARDAGTGPADCERLGVDAEAVGKAGDDTAAFIAELVSDEASLLAGLSAAWCQGFLSGVVAARVDANGGAL